MYSCLPTNSELSAPKKTAYPAQDTPFEQGAFQHKHGITAVLPNRNQRVGESDLTVEQSRQCHLGELKMYEIVDIVTLRFGDARPRSNAPVLYLHAERIIIGEIKFDTMVLLRQQPASICILREDSKKG
jgi:hypothetical protein